MSRLTNYTKLVSRLRAGGVRVESILAFPIRRRVSGENRILLKNGITLSSPAGEPLLHLFQEIFVDHRYSIDEFELRSDATIVDIGAHVGVFAAWISTLVPSARIISVEPSTETFHWLRKNVEQNWLNVETVAAACAAPDREVVLYVRGEGAMNSIFAKDVAGSDFREISRPETVTLQELFGRFNINHCDLLKLDCEGAEYEILFSAPKDLLAKVKAITMEYHVGMNEHRPAEVKLFLEELGFEVVVGPLIDPEGGYLTALRY